VLKFVLLRLLSMKQLKDQLSHVVLQLQEDQHNVSQLHVVSHVHLVWCTSCDHDHHHQAHHHHLLPELDLGRGSPSPYHHPYRHWLGPHHHQGPCPHLQPGHRRCRQGRCPLGRCPRWCPRSRCFRPLNWQRLASMSDGYDFPMCIIPYNS